MPLHSSLGNKRETPSQNKQTNIKENISKENPDKFDYKKIKIVTGQNTIIRVKIINKSPIAGKEIISFTYKKLLQMRTKTPE